MDIRLKKALAVSRMMQKYSMPLPHYNGVNALDVAKLIIEEVEKVEVEYLNDKHEAFLETMETPF